MTDPTSDLNRTPQSSHDRAFGDSEISLATSSPQCFKVPDGLEFAFDPFKF